MDKQEFLRQLNELIDKKPKEMSVAVFFGDEENGGVEFEGRMIDVIKAMAVSAKSNNKIKYMLIGVGRFLTKNQ